MQGSATEKDVADLQIRKLRGFRSTAAVEKPSAPSSEASLKGTFEKPPKGVGQNWIYLVEQGLWVNPEKIDVVVAKELKGKPAKK